MQGPAEAMPADPWPGRQTAEPARSDPQQLSCSCQVSTILLLRLQGGERPVPGSPQHTAPGGLHVPAVLPWVPTAPCRASTQRSKAQSQLSTLVQDLASLKSREV